MTIERFTPGWPRHPGAFVIWGFLNNAKFKYRGQRRPSSRLRCPLREMSWNGWDCPIFLKRLRSGFRVEKLVALAARAIAHHVCAIEVGRGDHRLFVKALLPTKRAPQRSGLERHDLHASLGMRHHKTVPLPNLINRSLCHFRTHGNPPPYLKFAEPFLVLYITNSILKTMVFSL